MTEAKIVALSKITFHLFDLVYSIFKDLENENLKRDFIKAEAFGKVEKIKEEIKREFEEKPKGDSQYKQVTETFYKKFE